MRGPQLYPAARYRDHRGAHCDRHPAVRAGGLRCGDVDLWQRELTVRGKGGKDRIVKIGHQAARSLDRYLRARSRHAQAWRPQLWLGASNREPLTAAGIYQMTARRGRQCGVAVYPHRFRALDKTDGRCAGSRIVR